MARYIDEEKLIVNLMDYSKGKKTIGQCVTDTPTEEVMPIIYAEWKQVGDYDENDNGLFECSNCRCTDTHSKAVKVPYCWFCGAKMKEGD